MIERFQRTLELMKDAWQVLRQDKELLLFPLFSGIACAIVLATFAVPLYDMAVNGELAQEGEGGQSIGFYIGLLAFYVANYFIITFFNAGIIACAMIRMDGGDPTVADGLNAAWRRLPTIIGWALLAGVVGFILKMIEQRSQAVGKIVAGLLGMAWTVTSFLAVPLLVMERRGPLEALKHSATLLKETWGEQIFGNFGFGLVFFVLGLPAIVLLLLGVATGSAAGMGIFVFLAVVYWVILALVQSALQTIYQAAVYRYARFGDQPQGFRGDGLSGAFAPRY